MTRGKEAAERDKGLSLKLAVVDLTARLLGRSMRLESARGEGSTFDVAVACGDADRVAGITGPTQRHDLTGDLSW